MPSAVNCATLRRTCSGIAAACNGVGVWDCYACMRARALACIWIGVHIITDDATSCGLHAAKPAVAGACKHGQQGCFPRTTRPAVRRSLLHQPLPGSQPLSVSPADSPTTPPPLLLLLLLPPPASLPSCHTPCPVPSPPLQAASPYRHCQQIAQSSPPTPPRGMPCAVVLLL